MSIEMTFRQKLIRVAASSVICGLSFSFVVAESVDQRGRLLGEWVSAPAYFPDKYLPARPLQASINSFHRSEVLYRVAARNYRPLMSWPSPASIRRDFIDVTKVVHAAPVIVAEPIKVVAAAPVATPVATFQAIKAPLVREAAPPAPVVQPKPNMAKPEKMNTREVEDVLLSIHQVTQKLTQANKRGEKAIVTQGREVKENPAVVPVPHAPRLPKSPVPEIAASKTPMKLPGEQAWVLAGKITNTSIIKEAGHFEVSLFAGINSEGVAVGYPLTQQILPAGRHEFSLRVPASIQKGFLFGEFVSAKSGKRSWIAPSVNPWVKRDQQFAELSVQAEDVISTAAASPVKATVAARSDVWTIKGAVETMFAKSGSRLPQDDVVVKVRGRKESARTDGAGNFRLELPRAEGIVFLEFLKVGYHPTIVSVQPGQKTSVNVQLASREAIERLGHILGVRQLSAKGVFIGRAIQSNGAGLAGFTAQMSLTADGPFYFGDEGFPATSKKSTSTDGRFIFFNIEPGSGYVETAINGEAIAPFPIVAVEGGEMITKNLRPVAGSLKGRLFNPVAAGGMQPVSGARVRLEGSADWTTSDSFGAFSIGPFKWIEGERASLEFSAEKYHNHRYVVDPANSAEVSSLFAFPASYVRRLASSMDVDLDPYAGIIFGKVMNQKVRLDALADHSAMNAARDFYFDGQGRLRGSHAATDPRFGTYVIFNVPKGRSLLQGNDGDGKMRYSSVASVSPSSVTVIMQ